MKPVNPIGADMRKLEFYFVEITDTFGGEANYCWVRRYKVRAKSFLGAVQKISRHTGDKWHKTMDCGDFMRYDSKSGATCFFIEAYDPENHDNLKTEEI